MSMSLHVNIDTSRSASPAPGHTPQSTVSGVNIHLTPDPTPKESIRERGTTVSRLNALGAQQAAKLEHSRARAFFPDVEGVESSPLSPQASRNSLAGRVYMNLLNFNEGDLPFALATCNRLKELKQKEKAALETLRHPTSRCVRNGVYVLALVLAVAAVTLFLSNTQAWIDGAMDPSAATGAIYAAKGVSSSGSVLSLGYNFITKKKIEAAQASELDAHGQTTVIYDVIKARVTDKARALCAHFVEITPFVDSSIEIDNNMAIKKLYTRSELINMNHAREEMSRLVEEWQVKGRAAFIEKAMQELFVEDPHDPQKVAHLIKDFDLAVAAIAAYLIKTPEDNPDDENAKTASERVRERIEASVKNPWNGVINDARRAQETQILHCLDSMAKKQRQQQDRLLSRAFVAGVADRPAIIADPHALSAFVEGSGHDRKESGSLSRLQLQQHLRKLSSASGTRSRRDSLLLAVPEDADLPESESAAMSMIRSKSFGVGTLSRPDSLVEEDGEIVLGDFFSSRNIDLSGTVALNMDSRPHSRRASTASFDPLAAKVESRSISRNPSTELTPRRLPERPVSVAAAVQPAKRAPSADMRKLVDELMATKPAKPADVVLDVAVD